jgi:hypothetical protein
LEQQGGEDYVASGDGWATQHRMRLVAIGSDADRDCVSSGRRF